MIAPDEYLGDSLTTVTVEVDGIRAETTCEKRNAPSVMRTLVAMIKHEPEQEKEE